jgi:aspartyl/asparaginyl beta-hydroxylase (cupin superfamily)
MFVNPDTLPFVPQLRESWRDIRAELLALDSSVFTPWQETFLYETGWDVYGLYAFGRKDAAHCAAVPRTTEAVERIPGLVTAGFSSLKPRTHIEAHVGYSYQMQEDGQLVTQEEPNNGVLRLHLGLVVPPTFTALGCALRVGEHVQNWQEGECLCFDDTIQHEAWNRSEGTRVVLLVDFLKSAVAP